MNTEAKINDLQLINRYLKGDNEAIDVLVNHYQNRLYNVILKICRNHDDALELTQDSFVKAIENAKNFKGNSSFYTYLFRIGVNLAINFVNRKKRVYFTSMETEIDSSQASAVLRDFLVSDKQSNPADVVANKESVLLLRKAIAELDEKFKSVLVLRDIEQMSYEDISATLNLEIGTVKSRLFRARTQLKEKLMFLSDDS